MVLSIGAAVVDPPVLSIQAEVRDALDMVLTCPFLGFLRMKKNSQTMSIMEIIAPKPAPMPMPIFAPRDRPPLWFRVSTPFFSGRDRAKISSVMMCTETVGLGVVAVEAIMALREEICSEAADGMERL
jgi:hypothetical protein